MRNDLKRKYDKLTEILTGLRPRIVASSGGLDSLVLSVIAYRQLPDQTLIAHGVSPSVPQEASKRLKRYAEKERWDVAYVPGGEMEDENYLRNPRNRCYYCKKNLYSVLRQYAFDQKKNRWLSAAEKKTDDDPPVFILSGANQDDLAEYRPGLDAARECGVRHPFVEAGTGKKDIRELAVVLGLDCADIAASPCLSSRIYTGTRIDAGWLTKVDRLEEELRSLAGIPVLRCRVKDRKVFVEVPAGESYKLKGKVFEDFCHRVLSADPEILGIEMDPLPYRPGRAFWVS